MTESKSDQLKAKWDSLSKGVQVLICAVFIIVVGTLLFKWGYDIGYAFYQAIH